MTALNPYPAFTELAQDYGYDRYGPVPVGRWAEAYEPDESRCIRCGCAIGTVLEADDNGHDRSRFIDVWEDALLQGYCEDCCIDIENGTEIEPFPGEYGEAKR